MPSEHINVFVSSTWRDLSSHRRKVLGALLRAEFFPIGMESFSAAESPPLDQCLRMLDKADIFVGIIGYCYGSRPPGNTKSYTRLEYEFARRKGIPTLLFLISRSHPVTSGQFDTGDDAVALTEFKEHICRSHTVDFFDSPDHLAMQVLAALLATEQVKSRGKPASGSAALHMKDVLSSFEQFSRPLLDWPQTLVTGKWIDRPELIPIEQKIRKELRSLTLLLGPPGSGKSALIARAAQHAADDGFPVLAIKADYLPSDLESQDQLAKLVGVSEPIGRIVARIVEQSNVLIAIDQMDAVADLMDLRSGRLNVLLELIRSCQALPRVHILCSCREFEFRHDTRLNTLGAEPVILTLPAWENVSAELDRNGIAGAQSWPEEFRDILRTPQHLDVFLRRYEETGRTDPFDSYIAMLDELWERKVSPRERADVVYRLTALSLQQESHWIAAAELEQYRAAVDELIADGVLERTGLRIGFRHQTILEHARARLFTKADQSLAAFVLERQDALFVRPMLWSTLFYLRAASPSKYRKEISALLHSDLRLHLRYLLIDYLGQISRPEEFEIALMAKRLDAPDDRKRVLLAIRGQKRWFDALRRTHFPAVMGWPIGELWPMLGVISDAWEFAPAECMELIDRYCLPDAAKDELTWQMLRYLPQWDEDAVERVCRLIRRAGPGRLWWAEWLASIISAKSPELAPRVVAAALWKKIEQDADNAESEERAWHSRSPLEDSQGWHEVGAIAEAAPCEFLERVWPWFVAVVERYCSGVASTVVNLYDGWTMAFEADDVRYPVANAIETAVVGCARAAPNRFVELTKNSWSIERQPIQMMLARGLEAAAVEVPDVALEFLCSDPRRLHLGGFERGDQFYSCELIKAVAPHLTAEGHARLERTIVEWSQYRDPDGISGEQVTWDQEARLRLLLAIAESSRSAELAEFIRKQCAELPDYRSDRPRRRAGQVVEIPPMNKDEMREASDEAIIELLDRPTERGLGEWSEAQKCWIRPGGGEAAARQLAELAKEDPRRVLPLLPKMIALGRESTVGRVLSSIAETNLSDDEVFELIRGLVDFGAASEDFRSDASALLYKRCKARSGLPDDICDLLEGWLASGWDADYRNFDDKETEEADAHPVSVLWGYEGGLLNTDRSFWTFEALSHGLLMREPAACDTWIAALEKHLDRHPSERAWKSYCTDLRWLRLRSCNRERATEFAVRLFNQLPGVRDSAEGARLLAELSAILPRSDVERSLEAILHSTWGRGGQAFGELITLIALRDSEHSWAAQSVSALVDNGSRPPTGVDEDILLGLAFAAGRLWDEPEMRGAAGRILCRIVPRATDRIASAIGTVFWASEDFPADDLTESFLRAIAENPSVVKADWLSDLIGHLPALVPHRPELVLSVCRTVLSSCGSELAACAHELYAAGPNLVNIAMTLQRFDDTRAGGLDLFEDLLRLGVDEAYSCLYEIDLRPVPITRRNAPERRRRRRRR